MPCKGTAQRRVSVLEAFCTRRDDEGQGGPVPSKKLADFLVGNTPEVSEAKGAGPLLKIVVSEANSAVGTKLSA